MGVPMADPEQKRLFLQAAAEIGFNPDEFMFGGRGQLERAPGQPDRVVHHVHISRMSRWRLYEQGQEVRWLEVARQDLIDGAFRSPYCLDGDFTALRNERRYRYELECWRIAGVLNWSAKVRSDAGLAGTLGGTLPADTHPPATEILRELVESSIEERIGVE